MRRAPRTARALAFALDPTHPSLRRAGNWQEERQRLAAGEWLKHDLMAGAEVRPLESDVSIAPPTRDPYLPSTGQLVIPTRHRRSKLTNDSSRQGADDGYREYKSMTDTFFPPMVDRPAVPIATERNVHGTWGGPLQIDGRTKKRNSATNREKNDQEERDLDAPSDRASGQRMLAPHTMRHAFVPRETVGAHTRGGFGSTLPRNPPALAEAEAARLQSTSRESFVDWSKVSPQSPQC